VLNTAENHEKLLAALKWFFDESDQLQFTWKVLRPHFSKDSQTDKIEV
jgi:hypothetical protein